MLAKRDKLSCKPILGSRMIIFLFTISLLVVFGVALYFAYRTAKIQFDVQLKAFRVQAFKKQRQMLSEIKTLESKLNENVAITKQLAMSAPTKIEMPSNTPLARAEQRVINESKKFQVV